MLKTVQRFSLQQLSAVFKTYAIHFKTAIAATVESQRRRPQRSVVIGVDDVVRPLSADELAAGRHRQATLVQPAAVGD